MLVIKNKGQPATLTQLARAIERTGIVPLNKQHRIKVELRYLQQGPERFGEVDLDNAQQVELAAYRIARGQIPRPISGRQAPSRAPGVYALAIIGSGTTAAYYLDTLGPAHDHSGTIVIGQQNPWIHKRGQGISYINHTWRQVAMPSTNTREYGGNESFANRAEFGRMAEAVVSRRAGRWVKSSATRIEKLREGVYRISYNDRGPKSFKAEKVVFTAGAGSIRKPPEAEENSTVRNRSRIIDMDTFIRDKAVQEKPRGAAKRVVVWGSNAAIDAVAAAKKHGWTIAAWLYSRDGQPAWLPGTRYLSEPYKLQEVHQHVYTDRRRLKIQDSGGLLKVLDGADIVADTVDYVVYGLGSEDLLTQRQGGVMDPSVLEGQQALSPILDTSGVFGNALEQGRQAQAFLGWQNASGTFQVFGLAAENYAGAVDPRGNLARIAPTDPRVMALKQWLSGDVLTVGQLTYIRSALRAVNHFVPGSIEHGVDYSHADANALRVHLAARYPELPELHASWFIRMIKRIRVGSIQTRLPHGFTEQQVNHIEEQLRAKQEEFRGRRKQPTNIDAVNWQWQLAQALIELTPAPGEEVAEGLSKLRVEDR
ncbi:MAG: hypothetical protein ACJ8AT_27195 [Hyalangium sp.]|uniref:hypothetical protein n=1 Tax=Hyalangium sp. TaxID=2028555 RepID=UPI00389A4F69